jgi:GNAT superfamily N-acetyltransferase
MRAAATLVTNAVILPLRTRFRQEMNCQIVHDSIHTRRGWTSSYALHLEGRAAGFGSIAIAGPWKDKPTIFEFYVLPECRDRAFDLFETFVEASGARLMEIQSNDTVLAVMLHTYARDTWSEKIVFADQLTTALPANGAVLQQLTADKEIQLSIAERAGQAEWRLQVNGQSAGNGALLFHYNQPYCDLAMEIAEPFRRRGLGAYLVQELKRAAYQLGSLPCARCSPDNIGSRRTLQKAGLVPFAHILNGTIGTSYSGSAKTNIVP